MIPVSVREDMLSRVRKYVEETEKKPWFDCMEYFSPIAVKKKFNGIFFYRFTINKGEQSWLKNPFFRGIFEWRKRKDYNFFEWNI